MVFEEVPVDNRKFRERSELSNIPKIIGDHYVRIVSADPDGPFQRVAIADYIDNMMEPLGLESRANESYYLMTDVGESPDFFRDCTPPPYELYPNQVSSVTAFLSPSSTWGHP